jgi:hypothetical protein
MYGGAGYPMPVTTTVPTSVDSTPMQTKRNMDYFFSHLGEEPVQLYCSTCRTNVLTNVTYRPGLLTWLMSALGCCCCLCCVPFCMTCKISNIIIIIIIIFKFYNQNIK